MKRSIKIIILSLAIVLLLNTILFSVLTVYQAPYYDEAPSKGDSIYNLYASEKYNDVLYSFSTDFIRSGDERIQALENKLKSVSVTKLNKTEFYVKMFSLNAEDFVFQTKTTFLDDGRNVMKTIPSSTIYVYSKEDYIYVVCCEITEKQYVARYLEKAIYQTKDVELAKLLSEYKSAKNEGFQIILPEWRDDLSDFPKSYNSRQYALFFIIEFVVVVFISTKIIKDNKKEKVSAKYSKKSKT